MIEDTTHRVTVPQLARSGDAVTELSFPESRQVTACRMNGDAAPAEAVTRSLSWEETPAVLKADYPDGARVAVITDGTIQYFA